VGCSVLDWKPQRTGDIGVAGVGGEGGIPLGGWTIWEGSSTSWSSNRDEGGKVLSCQVVRSKERPAFSGQPNFNPSLEDRERQRRVFGSHHTKDGAIVEPKKKEEGVGEKRGRQERGRISTRLRGKLPNIQGRDRKAREITEGVEGYVHHFGGKKGRGLQLRKKKKTERIRSSEEGGEGKTLVR